MVLLIGAPACFGATDDPATVRTASGLTIVFTPGADRSTAAEKFIRELDRVLTRCFRAPRAGGCRVLISAARPPNAVEFQQNDRGADILLGDRLAEHCADPEFFRNFAGALLRARFGVAEVRAPLPDWIAAGLAGEVLVYRYDGKLVRNTRYFPTLRGLLDAGAPPDFRALMTVKGMKFEGAMQDAYLELCRFLLESFASISAANDNALAEYAVGVMQLTRREDEIFESTLRRRAGADFQAAMTRLAFQFVFNNRVPRAAAPTLDALRKAMTIEREAADGSRQPLELFALPALLAKKDPANEALRRQFADQLRTAMIGMHPDIWPDAALLLRRVEETDGRNPARDAEELRRLERTLTEKMELLIKREQYLEQMENVHLSPFLLLDAELEETRRRGDFAEQKSIEFFDRIERKYLDE